MDTIFQYPWQTDTSIGKKSWGYIEGEENKTPNQIIDDFVDIVSKNGNLLLNITPRANGEIPEPVQERLLEIGKWLDLNGEAIYETRPWRGRSMSRSRRRSRRPSLGRRSRRR